MVGVTVSIVIAAVNDWDSLEECLGCLSPQLANHPEAELLIMDRCHDGWTEKIAAMCPEARGFVYNEKLSIPYLRAMGIEKALGEWVVIIEDHCMVENDSRGRGLRRDRRGGNKWQLRAVSRLGGVPL